MKPIAFFFTQFTDYGKLIRTQSNRVLGANGNYNAPKKKR